MPMNQKVFCRKCGKKDPEWLHTYDIGLSLCEKCHLEMSRAEAAAVIGSQGGKAKTEAKINASKENGKKGGRPKKVIL